MDQVIVRLNQDYHLGLSVCDADRLYAFLGGPDSDSITRGKFISGVVQLIHVFSRNRMHVTMQQLRVVVATAFDTFDADGDGTISVDEFAVAACKLGVELSASDVQCLHRFFTCAGSVGIRQEGLVDEKPMWEKWATAVQGTMSQIVDKTGWNGAERFLATVRQAFDGPGSFQDKVQRAQVAAYSSTESLAEAADFLGNSMGIISGLKYIEKFATEAQCCSSISDLDLDGLPPLLLFLILSTANLAKEFDGLVLKEMTEEEALLFAQVFYPLGFSQASFQKLVSCQGCQWRTAQQGELLNSSSDPALKILVKGRAEVRNPVSRAGHGVKLRPGSTIGETTFLRGKELWTEERVIASEPVLLVAWEPEALRELLSHEPKMESKVNRLLASSMADNLCALAGLQARSGRDGVRSSPAAVAEQLGEQPFHELWEQMGGGKHGVCLKDLSLAMRHMDSSLKLGATEDDIERLFSYLDVDGDGTITGAEFEERMSALHECMDKLGGLTLPELMSALRRSADLIDENQDGLISLEELQACTSRLELALSKQDTLTLHRYLDTNKDGFIDTTEWAGSASMQWVSALHVAVSAQAQQRGIPRLLFFAQRLGEAMAAPTAFEEKINKTTKVLWQGVDDITDFFGTTTDLAGVGAALYGIVQELEGVAAWDDVDPADLAPFVVFLGLSSFRYFQQLAEGQVSDLPEQEAILYAKVFEEDLTVREFQKLLTIGAARWEKIPAGVAIDAEGGGNGPEGEGGEGGRPVLRMVARGACEVQGRFGLPALVGIGGFLGESALLEQAEEVGRGATARALQSCLTLAWDAERLREDLAREPGLGMKVRRIVTRSAADRLLAMKESISQGSAAGAVERAQGQPRSGAAPPSRAREAAHA